MNSPEKTFNEKLKEALDKIPQASRRKILIAFLVAIIASMIINLLRLFI